MNIQNVFLALGMIVISLSGCNDTKKQVTNDTATVTTVQQKTKREIISSEKLKSVLAESPNVQLVDVRTASEFESGHLANAINISITDGDFESQISKLDKTEPIYIYCKSGARSARACNAMEEMGFVEMYDLKGGITSWKSAGLSVE